MEALTSAIINKILHDPVTLLKKTNEERSIPISISMPSRTSFNFRRPSLKEFIENPEKGLTKKKKRRI